MAEGVGFTMMEARELKVEKTMNSKEDLSPTSYGWDAQPPE
jgi:hypothetical protein